MSIAFFIRNTSFYQNYIKPYSDLFLDKGYKIIILHTNSYTPDLNKKAEILELIQTFDISKNSIKSAKHFLTQNHTTAIISINFHSPMDIMINRLAINLGIQSIYMEHGLLSESPGKYIKSQNKIQSFRRLSQYLIKYASFAINSNNFFSELSLFVQLFLKKNYSQSPYNAFLLYSERSYKILSNKFNLASAKVEYSGYPINLTAKKISFYENDRIAVYIHQPFIYHQLGNCSYQDEFEFFKTLASTLRSNGYRLVIKIHPLESKDKYTEGINSELLTIVGNEYDLNSLIKTSSIVFGIYSTALFTALKFEKPIVQIMPKCYPKNNNIDIFNEVVTHCKDFNELEIFLKTNFEKHKSINYNNFLEEVVGLNNTLEDRVSKLIKLID
ncbi:MAG: hypothetical protein JXR60_08510 [Bacteroidales bacterium]|nr:hypothetical protein [Bacteroidales bacterium]